MSINYVHLGKKKVGNQLVVVLGFDNIFASSYPAEFGVYLLLVLVLTFYNPVHYNSITNKRLVYWYHKKLLVFTIWVSDGVQSL